MKTCGNCGVDVAPSATFCYGCGKPLERTEPVTVNQSPAALKLDCSACKTTGIMSATKVPRFSSVIRVIGGIILIPSFLGIGFAGLMLLSTVIAGSNMRTGGDPAAEAGAVVGIGIGFVFSLFIGAVALVSGVVGWLLLLNRNVWRCDRCGSVLDRA